MPIIAQSIFSLLLFVFVIVYPWLTIPNQLESYEIFSCSFLSGESYEVIMKNGGS
jgi:hypothetical protein